MPPKLTLYLANGACSLVPHILLRELNIPFTPFPMAYGPNGVEGADGSLSHAEYLKIYPAGLTPALLVDDDIVVTELPAILTYIAGLAPERDLFGKTAIEQAKVYEWLCWLSGTLHGAGYGAILRPSRFSDDTSMYAAIVDKGRAKVQACYERIEKSLTGAHAVGNALTVADFNIYIFWGWGLRKDFVMLEHYPKYGELVKAVEKLDSVREAMEAEHLPLVFPEQH